MEGRPPDDDLFEWTDAPARPPRPQRPDTRERPGLTPTPPTETGAEDPLATGERRAVTDTRLRRGRRSDPEERRRVRGDTGEFERSGRRPPSGRRARHRDLPARVRRRQAFGIGGAVLAVIIGLILLISSGGGGKQAPIPLKRLVGQTIVAQVKGTPSQDLLKRVRHGQVGGVIVLPKDAGSLRTDVQHLQQAAIAGHNPPLLVMIDQEGGSVKRLKDGPPDVSPQQLGMSGDEGKSKDEGQKTGSYLKDLGVNVDLAPVLDVSQPQSAATIKSRTFGSDPAVVAKVGVAFALGLQDGGVFATAKHFPGLGRATVNTDNASTSIAATTDQLQSDLVPFKFAADSGVGLMMVSTASYPTLGSRDPAAFAPAIVRTLLRGKLGFDGVVITDDLDAPAVTLSPGSAAAAALKAGDDLLLFAQHDRTSATAFADLAKAVKQGKLDRATVQGAYDRITSLKDNLK